MILSQENKKRLFLILSLLTAVFIFSIIPFARDLSVIISGMSERGLFYPFIFVSFGILWLFILILMKDYIRVRFPAVLISIIAVFVLIYLTFSMTILLEKIHLLLYGGLSVFIFFYFIFSYRKDVSALLSLAICFNAGYLDELVQYFVPRRVGDYRDIYFNAISSVLGIAIFFPIIQGINISAGKKLKAVTIIIAVLFFIFFTGFILFVDMIHGYGYIHKDGEITFYSSFGKEKLKSYDKSFGKIYEEDVLGILKSEMRDYIKQFSRKDDPYIFELVLRVYRFLYFRNRLKYEELSLEDQERFAERFYGERHILETYFANGILPIRDTIYSYDYKESLKLKQRESRSVIYRSMVMDDLFYHFSRSMLIALLVFLQVFLSIYLYIYVYICEK